MKSHFAKAWSWYVLALSILGPYIPMINAAISQGISGHPKLIAGAAGVIAWVAHRLPPPSSVA